MQTSILITNNADRHPAHKWAAVTAAHIVALIEIDEASASGTAKAARRAKTQLEYDIADALESHYEAAQAHEKGQLAVHGHERLAHDYAPHKPLHETALADVLAIFDKPEYDMFAGHFGREVVQTFVANNIGQHMVSQAHIERLSHAKRTPDTDHAKVFLAKHAGETPAQEA